MNTGESSEKRTDGPFVTPSIHDEIKQKAQEMNELIATAAGLGLLVELEVHNGRLWDELRVRVFREL